MQLFGIFTYKQYPYFIRYSPGLEPGRGCAYLKTWWGFVYFQEDPKPVTSKNSVQDSGVVGGRGRPGDGTKILLGVETIIKK